MDYILFFIYLFIISYLIRRWHFIRDSGIRKPWIIPLFLTKISAGLLIGWLSQRYYPGNDYWALQQEGILEYQLLKKDPASFASNIFSSVYQHYGGFFDSVGSYWNDLKNNLIIKAIAICNIFSGGNYYINSIFFNSVCFAGLVALFRVYRKAIPGKETALAIACFLVPSTLYFGSGIYKDLVVLAMLGFYAYALYQIIFTKASVRRWTLLILSWLIILLIRNYIAVILLPISLGMYASSLTRKKIWAFAATILLMLSAFSSNKVLSVIVQKKKDFASLPVASTQLSMPELEPNAGSFLSALPTAINHGFFRPYIWDGSSPFLIPMAVELLLLQILALACIFFHKRQQNLNHSFLWFGIGLAVSLLMITGLIIPNTGSIVRYRSIFLPFLLAPILSCINWDKIKSIIHIK